MSDSASTLDQAGRPSQESGGIRLRSVHITHISPAASPTTHSPAVVRVAYQVGRNIYHYAQPGILAHQTNAAVMSDVRTTFKAAQVEASTWAFRLSQRMFRKLLVEEASVSPGVDVERGVSTTRIIPQKCVPRTELTMLFNGQESIEGDDNFAQQFPNVVTNSPVIHVLVVTSALKKTVAGCTFLLLSIVCAAIGVGIGFAVKDWFKAVVLTSTLWTLISLLLAGFVFMGHR